MNKLKTTTLLSLSLLLAGCASAPIPVSDHSTVGGLRSRWLSAEGRLGRPNQEFRELFRDSLNELVYTQGELDKTKVKK